MKNSETEVEKRERLMVECMYCLYEALHSIPLPSEIQDNPQGWEALKRSREALRRAHSILGDLRSNP